MHINRKTRNHKHLPVTLSRPTLFLIPRCHDPLMPRCLDAFCKQQSPRPGLTAGSMEGKEVSGGKRLLVVLYFVLGIDDIIIVLAFFSAIVLRLACRGLLLGGGGFVHHLAKLH